MICFAQICIYLLCSFTSQLHAILFAYFFSETIGDKGKYWFLLGKLYNCSGKFRTKSLDALCKAVKLNSECVDAWNELGECYWYNLNVKMALQCFERALEKVRVQLVMFLFYCFCIFVIKLSTI